MYMTFVVLVLFFFCVFWGLRGGIGYKYKVLFFTWTCHSNLTAGAQSHSRVGDKEPHSSSDKKLVFLLISTGNIICEICNNHGTVQLSSSSSSSPQHRKSRMICDATTSTTALLRMFRGIKRRDAVQSAAGKVGWSPFYKKKKRCPTCDPLTE